MSQNKPKQKKFFQIDWYWGLLGFIGLLGTVPGLAAFYIFFAFFLFLLVPVTRKVEK